VNPRTLMMKMRQLYDPDMFTDVDLETVERFRQLDLSRVIRFRDWHQTDTSPRGPFVSVELHRGRCHQQ
jgi:hypothetical protein